MQAKSNKAKILKLAASLPKGKKHNKRVFQYQGLSYISKSIYDKLINCYHNNSFIEYFIIHKI